MKNIVDMIKHQHAYFALTYLGKPKKLSKEEKAFYITAMKEELQEYEDASDLEEEFDALLDLVVFAIGGMLRQGFPIEDGMIEVVNANMDKIIGTNAKRNDFQLDLIKPEGWQAPNIKRVLEQAIAGRQ